MRVLFSYSSGVRREAIAGMEELARRVARRAFKAAGIEPAAGAELSVLLTDDEEIRALNKEWRGMDKATNVLSFETGDERMYGDIALSIDTLEREAEAAGKTLRAHFAHLLAHGTLHLLGFDHMGGEEADEMEFFEGKILEELGFENPYE